MKEVYDVETMGTRRYTCALDAADEGGLSVSEVADALGITRKHITQILTRAMRKVRTELVAQGIADEDDVRGDVEVGDEPPESYLEKKFVELCEARGWLALKKGKNGYPDRLVLLPGEKCHWVELKSASGALAHRQRHVIRRLLRLGQRVSLLKGTVDDCELIPLTLEGENAERLR